MAIGTWTYCIHVLIVIGAVTAVRCNLDVGFILDASGGTNDNNNQNWEHILDFINDIGFQLSWGCTQFGAVNFSETAQVVVWTGWEPREAAHLLRKSYQPGIHANISGGLYIARTVLFNEMNGDRGSAPNVAVVITHSMADLDVEKTIPMAQALQGHVHKVISIGITTDVDEGVVKAISSQPQTKGADYFMLSDFSGLKGIIDTVVDIISSIQRIKFQQDLDIGLILDASGPDDSTGSQDWIVLLRFVDVLIDHLPKTGTQVGIVFIQDRAKVISPLNMFVDLCEAKNYVRYSFPFEGGTTNTSDGLHVANTELFNEENGDRPNAPNVAILISNRKSDIDSDKVGDMARALHQRGIKVMCIGGTNEVDEHELREISSPPHRRDVNYFLASNFYQHQRRIDMIVKNIGEPRTVTMETEGDEKPPNGVTPIGMNPDGMNSTGDINIVLHIVLPVVAGLVVVVAIVIIIGCIIHKRIVAAVKKDVRQNSSRKQANDNDLHTYEDIQDGNYETLQDRRGAGSKEAHSYQVLDK